MLARAQATRRMTTALKSTASWRQEARRASRREMAAQTPQEAVLPLVSTCRWEGGSTAMNEARATGPSLRQVSRHARRS